MNKKIILGISAVIIILAIGIIAINFNSNKEIIRDVVKKEESTDIEGTESILNFIEAIAGLKANSVEIIDNPVGVKGIFFAPDETIVKGINYFLKETNNDKMENLNIKSHEGVIAIKVDYRVKDNIKTPIELRIKPTLNDKKHLVINIEEVRFLDLKIANWIVNMALDNFVEDWFPKDGDLKIDFTKGSVILYKDNFKGIVINKISLENGLEIEVVIDLKEIL